MESCGKAVEKLQKSCGKAVEKLWKSCREAAEKLRKSYGKAAEKPREFYSFIRINEENAIDKPDKVQGSKNDIFYTPSDVVDNCMKLIEIEESDILLDPFYGEWGLL